jgi:sulfur carrier protein
MKIYINQEEKNLNESCSLNQLLESINVKDIGIALAVNQSVIPKNSWDKYTLKENDNVLLIRATQGG